MVLWESWYTLITISGESSMEKIDPHKTHNYSHDQMLLSAFGHELRNTIALVNDRSNELTIVENYLKQRIDEIKERWK